LMESWAVSTFWGPGALPSSGNDFGAGRS